ncbi:E3 ubiquitin-protein ligase RNF220-like [Anthonomus grandis grandis]|uniref:E3 ubiquitin-protein ligase RNF220-like n=1 Tax=Anthonomus grandis grandis TaxID=2921223 RepID=UPI002165FFED|nr:E3 ubiquitin-protein ligase RNF220-like [Anthonomus grandis grandis]
MEVYEDNREVPVGSYNPDEGGRGCRTKKRQVDPTCCPVCSVTLRQTEVDSHLNVELEKLNRIPTAKIKANGKSTPSCSNGTTPSTSTFDPDKNWETFQKVKNNRQNRLRTKTRKRKADEQACPVCNKEVQEDLTLHVELCLRKSEQGPNSDDENIDIESFEEYEWAGQSRVRVTSLLPGGVASLGQSMQTTDDDEDLNVDGEEAEKYGSPQYCERDIIIPCEEAAENIALRKAVIGSEPQCISTEGSQTSSESTTKGDPVLQVLKNRIKELESRLENKDEIYKCLICMERYQTPVTSVCCWHVHCEKCWLLTLGAKKLCPQCNMITSAGDLRKIYM